MLLHYELDLALFDGYHTPVVTSAQEVVLHCLSDILILMECYDLERAYVEGASSCPPSSLEGTVNSAFRITFARQALHFNPHNGTIRLFLGRAFRFLHNPLACVFNYLASQNTRAPITALSNEELCAALMYYRSQYIRLRTENEDVLSTDCESVEVGFSPDTEIKPDSGMDAAHSVLQTRLSFYSFLYLVDICVMKIGIRDADYVFLHFEEHFDQMMKNEYGDSKLLSENALMFFSLISILCAHNAFFPFLNEEAGSGECDVLINLSWYCQSRFTL